VTKEILDNSRNPENGIVFLSESKGSEIGCASMLSIDV
jgi:hypothetical protein